MLFCYFRCILILLSLLSVSVSISALNTHTLSHSRFQQRLSSQHHNNMDMDMDMDMDMNTQVQLYTNNNNEVNPTKTTVTPKQMVQSIIRVWPGITPQAARTLTAQWVQQTKNAQVYNWNVGRFYCTKPDIWKHFYLPEVTGVCSSSVASAGITWRRIFDYVPYTDITSSESCVYTAPSSVTRFLTYPNLDAGTTRWITIHQNNDMLTDGLYIKAANKGDVAFIINFLYNQQYYVGTTTTRDRDITTMKKILQVLDEQQYGQ